MQVTETLLRTSCIVDSSERLLEIFRFRLYNCFVSSLDSSPESRLELYWELVYESVAARWLLHAAR